MFKEMHFKVALYEKQNKNRNENEIDSPLQGLKKLKPFLHPNFKKGRKRIENKNKKKNG